MKILSDNELRGLNKNTLIKTIKELQKERNCMACLANDLQETIDEAIEYIERHKVEWTELKFQRHNKMVKFNEYSNPQALLDILQGGSNE